MFLDIPFYRTSPFIEQALVEVILAKARSDESDYLRLLQEHHPLKRAVVSLGSSSPAAEKKKLVAKLGSSSM